MSMCSSALLGITHRTEDVESEEKVFIGLIFSFKASVIITQCWSELGSKMPNVCDFI